MTNEIFNDDEFTVTVEHDVGGYMAYLSHNDHGDWILIAEADRPDEVRKMVADFCLSVALHADPDHFAHVVVLALKAARQTPRTLPV